MLGTAALPRLGFLPRACQRLGSRRTCRAATLPECLGRWLQLIDDSLQVWAGRPAAQQGGSVAGHPGGQVCVAQAHRLCASARKLSQQSPDRRRDVPTAAWHLRLVGSGRPSACTWHHGTMRTRQDGCCWGRVTCSGLCRGVSWRWHTAAAQLGQWGGPGRPCSVLPRSAASGVPAGSPTGWTGLSLMPKHALAGCSGWPQRAAGCGPILQRLAPKQHLAGMLARRWQEQRTCRKVSMAFRRRSRHSSWPAPATQRSALRPPDQAGSADLGAHVPVMGSVTAWLGQAE